MAVTLKAILGFDGKAYEAGMKKATALSKKAQKNIGGNLKSAIGSTLAVGFLANKGKEIGEFARQVQNLAPALGMTTDQLQEWEYVFKRAGLEIDDVADAFATLADRTEDALAGTESMIEDFRLVGLNVDQLRGKNPQELFNTFADAVANTEDKNRALASIVRNLGDDLGRKLAPMLMMGKEGMAELRKEAQELGIVMDSENIQEVASQMIEIQIASMQLRGVWSELTVVASKLFTTMMDGFKVLNAINPIIQGIKGVGAAYDAAMGGKGAKGVAGAAFGAATEDALNTFNAYEKREAAAKAARAKGKDGFTRSKGGINDEIEAKKAQAAFQKKVNDAAFKELDNEGKINALFEKRVELMDKIKNATGKKKYELMGEQFDINQQMESLKTGAGAAGRTSSLSGAQGVGAFVRRANPMLKVAQNQLKALEQIKANTTPRSASTVENPYGSGTAAA
ncbi:hypothetical protein N8697_00705 [bacterium]|nr:hypothetical protein [bacterium]